MDCEECEFDVILNDYKHVRLFRELVIEYHSNAVKKSLKELLKILGTDYRYIYAVMKALELCIAQSDVSLISLVLL